jgi:hypothetical protein
MFFKIKYIFETYSNTITNTKTNNISPSICHNWPILYYNWYDLKKCKQYMRTKIKITSTLIIIGMILCYSKNINHI